MFAAYFDDSGTHDDTGQTPGSEVVAAAGYVGAPAEWETLTAEWNTLLQAHSLPFYHSADCAAGVRRYQGMTNVERNSIHRAFVETIVRRRIVAVGAATHTARFRERYEQRKSENAITVPRQAYYECIRAAWLSLGFYMSVVWPAEQVAVVVEHAPKTTGLTTSLYDQTLATPSWAQISGSFHRPLSFQEKVGNPQLQAADVLAWEMGLELRRRFVQQVVRTRRSWEALAVHALEQAGSISFPLLRFNEQIAA